MVGMDLAITCDDEKVGEISINNKHVMILNQCVGNHNLNYIQINPTKTNKTNKTNKYK
jgi:hypothetical protein